MYEDETPRRDELAELREDCDRLIAEVRHLDERIKEILAKSGEAT